MPDQPVREIQLGGKQLVFLFMASVVLAVAIFLLGISVGRGVHTASDDATTTTDVAVAGDAIAPLPTEMPPATETTSTDLRYHDQLQGQSTPPAQPQPAPAPKPVPVDEPPAVADQPPTATSATAAAPKSTTPAPGVKTAVQAPPAKSPEKAPEKPVATAKPNAAAQAPLSAGAGTWFVQVDSFRSRENADRQAAKLKAKNYAAAVSTSAGLFRVRVGPFTERAEADRVRLRLQREEGLKPSIQR